MRHRSTICLISGTDGKICKRQQKSLPAYDKNIIVRMDGFELLESEKGEEKRDKWIVERGEFLESSSYIWWEWWQSEYIT